jgi:hypothetical protein
VGSEAGRYPTKIKGSGSVDRLNEGVVDVLVRLVNTEQSVIMAIAPSLGEIVGGGQHSCCLPTHREPLARALHDFISFPTFHRIFSDQLLQARCGTDQLTPEVSFFFSTSILLTICERGFSIDHGYGTEQP